MKAFEAWLGRFGQFLSRESSERLIVPLSGVATKEDSKSSAPCSAPLQPGSLALSSSKVFNGQLPVCGFELFFIPSHTLPLSRVTVTEA